MKINLLRKAKSLGCEVYKNYLNEWTIEGLAKDETWLIQEQKSSDTWLIICENIPLAYLNTEVMIETLDSLTKNQKSNREKQLIDS